MKHFSILNASCTCSNWWSWSSRVIRDHYVLGQVSEISMIISFQFLILFNFHITILDTFNEENLTLDKPVIYRDEEISQTGRNRFTRGIKWVRKGPGANFVGFIGRLWKLLFLTNRKSWKFCSQWQDILTSPWQLETVFKSPNASIHNIKRRYVPLT